MKKSVRKAIIAGNWKMNKGPAETKEFISELIPMLSEDGDCEVVICVPYVDVITASEAAVGSRIKIGAENVHFEEKGAYTGEVSAKMLLECGAEYVIIGHSERRQYFGETDETVNKRTKAALAAGLTPIVCVGESLDERDAGVTVERVATQVKYDLRDIPAEDAKRVVIAYEPIWAIGTGRVATADQADEVCGAIRKVLSSLYGEETAEAITIQYGGSMSPDNAAELLEREDIDGGLIGGASLVPSKFIEIIKAAEG